MFHFISLLLYKLSDLATDYLDLFLGLLLVMIPVGLVFLQQNLKLLVVKLQAVKVRGDPSSQDALWIVLVPAVVNDHLAEFIHFFAYIAHLFINDGPEFCEKIDAFLRCRQHFGRYA